MESKDGMLPFHLPLPVRVRIDGTSPHLPPLTEMMNEECRETYIQGGSAPGRYATHNTQDIVSFSFLLLLSFLELTQASERLRLTAARGFNPSRFPSLFRFLAFGIP